MLDGIVLFLVVLVFAGAALYADRDVFGDDGASTALRSAQREPLNKE